MTPNRQEPKGSCHPSILSIGSEEVHAVRMPWLPKFPKHREEGLKFQSDGVPYTQNGISVASDFK